jgi:hypothetical protein
MPNPSLKRSANRRLRKYRFGRLRRRGLRRSSKPGPVVGSWSLSYRARMNSRLGPNPALNQTGRYTALFLRASAQPAG